MKAFVGTMLLAGAMGFPGALFSAEPDFQPRRLVDPFPAIRDPKVVAGDKAGPLVRDDELVLGVTVGKEARAYPINMLTNPTREIINDTLGGQPITATW